MVTWAKTLFLLRFCYLKNRRCQIMAFLRQCTSTVMCTNLIAKPNFCQPMPLPNQLQNLLRLTSLSCWYCTIIRCWFLCGHFPFPFDRKVKAKLQEKWQNESKILKFQMMQMFPFNCCIWILLKETPFHRL